jgi:Domain of unknown function (DUF2019)
MKNFDIRQATVPELVDRFAAICVEQNNALFQDEIAKFNRLYDKMTAISEELKCRSGDQRRALVALLDHRDIQVRLQAARMSLAVAPQESRRTLEAIAASKWQPQAGDAGMSLLGLDRGEYVPK